MKSFKFIFVSILALICLCLSTCNNPLMETWWSEKEGGCPCTGDQICKCTGDSTCKCSQKSGANFAVVFFHSNGGTPQPIPFRVLYGNKIPRIRAITHLDAALYGFGGWIDENGKIWDMDTRTVKKEDDVDGDGIITLKANWSENFVTVKFVTNYNQIFGAESPANPHPKDQKGNTISVADQRIIPGNKVIEPPVLPTDGIHGLIGWFTTDGMPVDSLQDHNKININDRWNFENDIVNESNKPTITLYARWSTFSRTVHLQVNGGTRPNGQELTRVNFTIFAGLAGVTGGKIIDPGPLVREGYTFAGWYKDSGELWDFSTSTLNDVDEWQNGVLKNDAFILHARWVANIYYVTFNANGGSPVPATQNVEHGERALLPPIMTHSDNDMAFEGWRVGSANGAEYDFDKPVIGNLTLVARWAMKQYTVVFHLGRPGGNAPSNAFSSALAPPQHFVGDGKAREPFIPSLPASQITAWSFYGWYASNDPTNDDQTKINTINNAATQAVRDANLASAPWNFNDNISTGANSSNVLNLYARWVEPEPDMVWVARGSFIMGDSGVSGSPAAYHSYPTRRVTLDGFYISRYEITQVRQGRSDTNKSYSEVMGFNPSQFSRNEVRPVDRVSWYDAIEYCNKLTDLMDNSTPSPNRVYTITYNTADRVTITGTAHSDFDPPLPIAYTINNATVTANFSNRGYRLPTEAEWEYAARGGNNSPFNYTYSGSNDATVVAWYNDTIKTGAEAGSTQKVGTKAPNALGIYDMSGNITEWVWDRFESYKSEYYFIDYYSTKPANPAASGILNPTGPATGTERVRRGGGWSNAISNVRSVVRNSQAPGEATWVNGFRVVRGASKIW